MSQISLNLEQVGSQESDMLTKSDMEYLMNQLNTDNTMFPEQVYIDPEHPPVIETCDTTQPYLNYDAQSNGCSDQSIGNATNFVEFNGCSGSDKEYGPTGSRPCTNNYPGPFQFNLNVARVSKHSWAFSEHLSKIFIDMNKIVPVHFSFGIEPPLEVLSNLKIRAVLLYVSPDHVVQPVNRCTTHWCDTDPNNQAHITGMCRCDSYRNVGHVLTVENENASYEFDPYSKRHSVSVPIQPLRPAQGYTSISYRFNCKTSCQGGMGRRQTNLIFTLEDKNGEVMGRTSFRVKVCSCPKRDKGKEEADLNKSKNETMQNGAKRKQPSKFIHPQQFQLVVNNEESSLRTSSKKIKIDPHISYGNNQVPEVYDTSNHVNGSLIYNVPTHYQTDYYQENANSTTEQVNSSVHKLKSEVNDSHIKDFTDQIEMRIQTFNDYINRTCQNFKHEIMSDIKDFTESLSRDSGNL